MTSAVMHYLLGRAQQQSSNVRCHSSQGQIVQQGGPNISRLEPALEQQWDHAALMLIWDPLTSHQEFAERPSGHVISAQMATRTAGRHLSKTEEAAQVVLSAAATKCASTTP